MYTLSSCEHLIAEAPLTADGADNGTSAAASILALRSLRCSCVQPDCGGGASLLLSAVLCLLEEPGIFFL